MQDAQMREILSTYHTIAVVGLSPDPSRPSNSVAQYLKGAGYRIIPVNPTCQEVLGERCYPTLEEIPDHIDIVDIFRRSEHVLPVVEEAIRKGAKVVWMQQGIVNHEAARRAEEAGLLVVMDRCLLREHSRLFPHGSR